MCFFQVSVPEAQRDLLRVVWYRDNNLERYKTQFFRFTRHVWELNSSPYVALFAIERLVAENNMNASHPTLTAIENYRYMDNLLLSTDSLVELEVVSQESAELFQSRGFRLRKWVANSISKSVLSGISQCDLGPSIRKIDLGSQLVLDSKALGLAWDVEHDSLRVCTRRTLHDIKTRREMLRALASLFDPTGFLAPRLLGGKLLLQKVTTSGLAWDDKLPTDVIKEWKSWVEWFEPMMEFSVSRCYFPDCSESGFCDASNCALSCVVCTRVALIQAKSNW